MKKLNLNSMVRAKLNQRGVDIYYHQNDDLIERGVDIPRRLPGIDKDGFTTFQLWDFMNLYGKYLEMGAPEVLEELSLYIKNDDLEEERPKTHTDAIENAPVRFDNGASEPVDTVTVTRCKSCRYARYAKVNSKGFLICPASGMEITPDDYCSYAERPRFDNAGGIRSLGLSLSDAQAQAILKNDSFLRAFCKTCANYPGKSADRCPYFFYCLKSRTRGQDEPPRFWRAKPVPF